MMNQYIEELARLYGIEINDVEPGKGGLFYGQAGEKKIELQDIFGLSDARTFISDNVCLEKCNITNYEY